MKWTKFEPFVFEGFVSLSDDSSPQPIKIMRDTCCAQSMILEGTLSFDENSSTGISALIRGIRMEIISVPLPEGFSHFDGIRVCAQVLGYIFSDLGISMGRFLGLAKSAQNDILGVFWQNCLKSTQFGAKLGAFCENLVC